MTEEMAEWMRRMHPGRLGFEIFSDQNPFMAPFAAFAEISKGFRAYFDFVNGLFGSLVGRLILFGYTWALMHHMLGGLKHLVQDTGKTDMGALPESSGIWKTVERKSFY